MCVLSRACDCICFGRNTNTNHSALATGASQALSLEQVVLVMCQGLHIGNLGYNVVLLEDLPHVLPGLSDIQQNS